MSAPIGHTTMYNHVTLDLEHLNGLQPSSMSLIKPVLFLLSQVKTGLFLLQTILGHIKAFVPISTLIFGTDSTCVVIRDKDCLDEFPEGLYK